jgi:hypothetical protein
MAGSEDLSPTAGDNGPNDMGGPPATRNGDEDVAQLVTDDGTPGEGRVATLEEPKKALGDGLNEAEELSSIDGASVDALPRRAGSPIDSLMSGPDDSPSVQVNSFPPELEVHLELTCCPRAH